jgi:predicted N-acyltransferase
VLYEGEQLLAVMPMYLKYHSQGEYIFDHNWAQAYAGHGLDYYPKLVTTIPFTPCQGPRLCILSAARNDTKKCQARWESVLQFLKRYCVEREISSWHCLFPEQQDLKLLQHEQLLLRQSVQFQWFNKGHESFEQYLSTFTSKRRKTLKRERRRIDEQGIQISQLRGKEIQPIHWQQFFSFYQATYWKRGMREYLNAEFFRQLADNMTGQLLMVVAEKEERIVATALSFVGEHTLYGRYWGCHEEYHSLHFELCYYQGLEFCIAQKLRCFNSGAQGEHKISRGFEPVNTWSLHWIAHEGFREAIAGFVKEEAQHLDLYRQDAASLLPFNSAQAFDEFS